MQYHLTFRGQMILHICITPSYELLVVLILQVGDNVASGLPVFSLFKSPIG